MLNNFVLKLPTSPNGYTPHSYGRLVAPTYVKFGRAERHMGPLGRVKFRLSRCTEMCTRPQNIIKLPHVGKCKTFAPQRQTLC